MFFFNTAIVPRINQEKIGIVEVSNKREVRAVNIPLPHSITFPIFIASFFFMSNERRIDLFSVQTIIGALVMAVGVFFTIWGRMILGKEWRPEVEVRKDHQLINSGPYTIVRHPMYLGLNTMALGSAILGGFSLSWDAILTKISFLNMIDYNRRKIYDEEVLLEEKFGDSWKKFKKETPYSSIPYIF